MKITIKTICALAGMLLVSCLHTTTAGAYTITGQLQGLPDGTCVQLTWVSHDKEKPFAETTVTGGTFSFQGEVPEPRAARLMVKDAYGSTPLILDQGDIEIGGKVTARETNGTPYYDFKEMTVSGSPMTDKYLRLMSVRENLDSIYAANNERYANVRAAYGKAYSAKDKARMDSIAHTGEYKASTHADSLFFAKVENDYRQVVMDNKDSFWGPLMMISLFSYLTEDQGAWYDALSPTAKASYYGKKVLEEIRPSSKAGSSVPAFTAKSQDGKSVTLAQLCQGKKYILIDFWASWCVPCRKEIPNLKSLYAQYADRGFQIVSISIDRKAADWQKALKEEQLQWPNYLDTEGIAELYKVKFVPTMYLIDAKGTIVAENLRGEALARRLAELLDK